MDDSDLFLGRIFNEDVKNDVEAPKQKEMEESEKLKLCGKACQENKRCASREHKSLTATHLERTWDISLGILVNTYHKKVGVVKISAEEWNYA